MGQTAPTCCNPTQLSAATICGFHAVDARRAERSILFTLKAMWQRPPRSIARGRALRFQDTRCYQRRDNDVEVVAVVGLTVVQRKMGLALLYD